jgi:Fe2+ or Zn2+ uptake regulation protein
MDRIPAGSTDAVMAILRAQSAPIRRRQLLAELEARGHRISLAGLNRVLEQATRNGLMVDGPDGIRPKAPQT